MASTTNSAAGSNSNNATKVKVMLLGDNANQVVQTKTFPRSKLREFLTDAGRVDCPVLRKVGLPLVLVSTTPGKKVIPVAQAYAGSRNPHNNHHATQMSIRDSGWATGCVVGPVYAVRTDGKDLTDDWFHPIWDTLMTFSMHYYHNKNLPIPAIAFEHHRQVIHIWMETGNAPDHMMNRTFLAGPLPSERDNPLYLPPSPGACHVCHKKEEQVEGGALMRCSACKTARYCNRDCQKAAWKLHKAECAQNQLEAQLKQAEQQLLVELGLADGDQQQQGLEGSGAAAVPAASASFVSSMPTKAELDAAVLRPEQVLHRDVEISAQLGASSPTGMAGNIREGLSRVIGQDLMQIFEYNRSQEETRICPHCYTMYKLRPTAASMTRYDKEQRLSGLCSYTCWRAMNPDNGSRYAGVEWYGQAAVVPEGVMLDLGGVVMGGVAGNDDEQ